MVPAGGQDGLTFLPRLKLYAGDFYLYPVTVPGGEIPKFDTGGEMRDCPVPTNNLYGIGTNGGARYQNGSRNKPGNLRANATGK